MYTLDLPYMIITLIYLLLGFGIIKIKPIQTEVGGSGKWVWFIPDVTLNRANVIF